MAVIRGPRDGISCVASGDMSGLQFRFVVKATDAMGRIVTIPASTGQQVEGVLQNKPRNAEHAAVVNQGNTKLFLGVSLGAGAEVMCASGGWGILATSGGWIGGYLVTGADSGLIAEAFMNPYRKSLA